MLQSSGTNNVMVSNLGRGHQNLNGLNVLFTQMW